ncbi:hypothetical protein VNO80_21003 [Phaseolus coccineus]|uniref:Uncharacterized protein n=1 Tax=Phaseolus coccineus TaxID=3886 RepID=A0AAN9M6Q4_PHACN
MLDSVLTSSQMLKFLQHFANLCRQRKHQWDDMKLEILSYAMEAKYISVELLPIQSRFKVQHGFPILNKSLKPTLQATRKTK